jgi:hypothetical protein
MYVYVDAWNAWCVTCGSYGKAWAQQASPQGYTGMQLMTQPPAGPVELVAIEGFSVSSKHQWILQTALSLQLRSHFCLSACIMVDTPCS